MIKKFFSRLDIRSIVIFVIIGALWNVPIVSYAIYPLKIFVVFMHELSHGLMAIATGGQIKEIVVVSQQGGHAITIGGSQFWILMAGYLGSLAWGGLILVLAARTHLDKLLSILIGVGLILVSIRYVRNPFGLGFGIAFGGVLGIIGLTLSESVNDLILRIIGLTSCLYAILDIKSDVLDRAHLRSDARMLSELTPISTLTWGVLWILIAIVGTLFFLYLAGNEKTAGGDRKQI